MKALSWILNGVLLALLVGGWDYTDALVTENAVLKARLATKIDAPSFANPICPSGNVMMQRVDKRNRKGFIVGSRWTTICGG